MKLRFILFLMGAAFADTTVKAQWTDISVPTNKDLNSAVFLDDLNGYVCSQSYNMVWKTTNGGISWDSTAFIETVVDIDFSDVMNGAVLLHGNPEYKIKVTNDGGSTWNYLNFISGPFESFSSIITNGTNNYFAMSYNYLLRSFDGGNNWDTIQFSGYPYSIEKQKISNDTLYFTGWDGTFNYQGAVIRSFDGGNSWNFIPTNDNYTNFSGTYFINGLKGFGVYNSGWAPDSTFLSFTNDAGFSWNVVHFDTSMTYQDVFMKSETEGYIALTENNAGEIQFTNDGINYITDYTSSKTFTRMYHSGSTLFAIGNSGVAVKKSVPLGILNPIKENIKIFPNPVADKINLKTSKRVLVDIYNAVGKSVFSKTIEPDELISVENFAEGIYMIRINDKGKISEEKIIIAR